MIKKIIFPILLTFAINASAAEPKVFAGTKDVPIELNLLLKSYQGRELSKEENDNLSKKLKNIDRLFQSVTKEEIFFTVKSEIYKTVLKFGSANKQYFDLEDAKNLQKMIKKSKDPFIHWLLTALDVDADNLINGAYYKDYLLQRSSGRYLTNETKKIAKKMQLVSRIFFQFNNEDPDSTKTDLYPIYEQCLNNIEESLFILASESKFEKIKVVKEEDAMLFFKLEDVKAPVIDKGQKDKSVEDILDGDLENLNNSLDSAAPKKTIVPKPVSKDSGEDWDLEESSPIDVKKLPKPTNDADWLQDI